jgi:RsiW-degrading membrane proteinase PrsW (M82 family)
VAVDTHSCTECPRCAAQIERLSTPSVPYCIACGAPLEIPLAVPSATSETAALPRSLAIVERKYSTMRRALVAEAGVLVIVAGALVLLELMAGAAFGGLHWLLAGALAIGPIPALVALGMWLDRFEPEPAWLLARTFLWGAAVAILVAGVVNTVAQFALGKFVASVVSAPFIEEGMKGLAVLHVFRRRREHLDGVTDGIIYALFVGLGFAAVENIHYYADAIEDGGATGLAIVFGIRGLLTPFLHPFFTMFTGIALGLVVTRHGLVRWIVPLVGYLVAVFMHALWNSGIGMLLYPVLFVPGFVIASLLLVVQRAHQRDLLDRFIAPEVATGLIGAADLERIRNASGSMRVALASLRTSDHPLHAWRELNHAGYTLAMHRYNVVRRWHRGCPPTARDAEVDGLLRERIGTARRLMQDQQGTHRH